MISEWELGNDFKKGNILFSFFLSTMNARVEEKVHDWAFLLEEGHAYTRPVWISEFGRIW